MNFKDYVTAGQVVDFELESGTRNLKVLSRIQDISNSVLKLSVIDDDVSPETLVPGAKGIVWGKKKGLEINMYVEIVSVQGSVFEVNHLPSRSHLRVDAFIKLAYRALSRDEFAEKRKKYLLNTAADSDRYVQRFQRFESEGGDSPSAVLAPEIIGEIRAIHKKLDFIIRTIGKNEEKNIYTTDPVQVNISGSGLRFIAAQQFASGDFLDMEMIIPISSGIMIDVIGEVVRSDAVDSDTRPPGGQAWDTAVTFAAISQDDRELIIHYIFKRQRELLRAEDTP